MEYYTIMNGLTWWKILLIIPAILEGIAMVIRASKSLILALRNRSESPESVDEPESIDSDFPPSNGDMETGIDVNGYSDPPKINMSKLPDRETD